MTWAGGTVIWVAGISCRQLWQAVLQMRSLAQIFVGVKPVPKLDIKASYTLPRRTRTAQLAELAVSKNYGSELDVTATYKIYDNLSYMVGFAYLWAGDYWKGTNSAAHD